MPDFGAVRNDNHSERARLITLLDRATRLTGAALAEATLADEELSRLLAESHHRQLDGDERTRYAALAHDERLAANRYTAARHWRDAITARMRELRLRQDEVAGPAA
jgi:hypothetical protein